MNPFPVTDTDLDTAIARAHSTLSTLDPEGDDYRNVVNRLTDLYALRERHQKLVLELHEFETKHTLEVDQLERQIDLDALPFYKRVDPNTVVTVAGNIFIGLAVIKYEQTGVIATKVMSFLRKS